MEEEPEGVEEPEGIAEPEGVEDPELSVTKTKNSNRELIIEIKTIKIFEVINLEKKVNTTFLEK